MRYFKQAIPMGCGEMTELDLVALRSRLSTAITIVGGLQQPDHPTSDEHAAACQADRKEVEAELLDAVRDILTALGVRVVGDLEV